jgi:two-component system phosphoglycerate transport system response regulator PgtA
MTYRTIAVIDDDADTRRWVADILEQAGYRVHAFENPLLGLSFTYETRPDLIILDYRMPRVDGLSLLPSLRAVSQDTPVLLLTGHADPDLFMDAFQKGACEMLSKPVSPEELLRNVERILSN